MFWIIVWILNTVQIPGKQPKMKFYYYQFIYFCQKTLRIGVPCQTRGVNKEEYLPEKKLVWD